MDQRDLILKWSYLSIFMEALNQYQRKSLESCPKFMDTSGETYLSTILDDYKVTYMDIIPDCIGSFLRALTRKKRNQNIFLQFQIEFPRGKTLDKLRVSFRYGIFLQIKDFEDSDLMVNATVPRGIDNLDMNVVAESEVYLSNVDFY
jgi:hypothetical protein